jgi:hypothetical protein
MEVLGYWLMKLCMETVVHYSLFFFFLFDAAKLTKFLLNYKIRNLFYSKHHVYSNALVAAYQLMGFPIHFHLTDTAYGAILTTPLPSSLSNSRLYLTMNISKVLRWTKVI